MARKAVDSSQLPRPVVLASVGLLRRVIPLSTVNTVLDEKKKHTQAGATAAKIQRPGAISVTATIQPRGIPYVICALLSVAIPCKYCIHIARFWRDIANDCRHNAAGGSQSGMRR